MRSAILFQDMLAYPVAQFAAKDEPGSCCWFELIEVLFVPQCLHRIDRGSP